MCNYEKLLSEFSNKYPKKIRIISGIRLFLRIWITDQKIRIPPCGSQKGKKIRIPDPGSQSRSSTNLLLTRIALHRFHSVIATRKYRAEKKSLQILLSSTQAGPGRKVKQEQEEISRNHVQAFFPGSVQRGK